MLYKNKTKKCKNQYFLKKNHKKKESALDKFCLAVRSVGLLGRDGAASHLCL